MSYFSLLDIFSVVLFSIFCIIPMTGFFRCLIGVHVLPKYPDKVREIGAIESYARYTCYRCKKEIIK